MSNNNIGLAKRILIAAIKAAPAFASPVSVDYAYSGKSDGSARAYVWGGRTSWEQSYAAMTSGTKPRDRKFTVDIHMAVYAPGGTVQETDDAVLVLLDALDALLAGDVTLGGAIPGIRYAGIETGEMTYGIDDDGVGSELIAHVTFSTRLF